MTLAVEAVFLGASSAVAFAAPDATATVYTLIAVTAFAMGLRNATVRRLGVPDLTTTVLTMTLTGLAADSRAAGGTGRHSPRRSASVAAMALGALLGAWLFLHHGLGFRCWSRPWWWGCWRCARRGGNERTCPPVAPVAALGQVPLIAGNLAVRRPAGVV